MSSSYTTKLSDARAGRRSGYIYAVFAPKLRAIYVGQTRNGYGALGRLAQHISYTPNATFRNRLMETFGYEEIDIGPVSFLAFDLGTRAEFTSQGAAYREAAEAAGQHSLVNRLARHHRQHGVVVSRVQMNAYCRLDFIVLAANSFAEEVLSWLDQENEISLPFEARTVSS